MIEEQSYDCLLFTYFFIPMSMPDYMPVFSSLYNSDDLRSSN